jgi:type IV secretory pathway VirB10-like protein
VVILTRTNIHRQIAFVTAVLIAITSTLLHIPNQASAQITPAPSILDSSVDGLEFVAQNTTDPLQNSTAANITQLATILPTVDQPVTPASFAPVTEESDESTSSSDEDDDDDENDDSNNNSDDDNGEDDDDDDDSGNGNGGSSVSVGGAFASVG